MNNRKNVKQFIDRSESPTPHYFFLILLLYIQRKDRKNGEGERPKKKDESGLTENNYDLRGNVVRQKKVIEDIVAMLQSEYDPENRLRKLVYPDGTKLHYEYVASGHLSGIKMDTADGTSTGHTIANYIGPILDGGFKVQRKTGNGVVQEISYDRIRNRLIRMTTQLSSGHIEQQVSYQYDERGNMTKLNDLVNTNRTQEFVYDALFRQME